MNRMSLALVGVLFLSMPTMANTDVYMEIEATNNSIDVTIPTMLTVIPNTDLQLQIYNSGESGIAISSVEWEEDLSSGWSRVQVEPVDFMQEYYLPVEEYIQPQTLTVGQVVDFKVPFKASKSAESQRVKLGKIVYNIEGLTTIETELIPEPTTTTSQLDVAIEDVEVSEDTSYEDSYVDIDVLNEEEEECVGVEGN